MTNQEIFDRVTTHLLKQGRPALDADTTCAYRSGTLSCAIGCLISDDHYDVHMEGYPADQLADRFPLAVSHLLNGTDDRIRFLMDLQGIHDEAIRTAGGRFARRELRAALSNFASGWGLSDELKAPPAA